MATASMVMFLKKLLNRIRFEFRNQISSTTCCKMSTVAPTKKLINSPETAVNDHLTSMARSNGALKILKDCKRVVVRSDLQSHLDSGKVSLICGGGSGHEPAFAGYVGAGMLTACVAGHVFASPPAVHVQHAIEATLGKAGTIVFVINYTGDRLHFGLATQRALAAHPDAKIKVIFLGDDTAIPHPAKATGRRGLAGSIMVLKIAGAMADAGKSVDEINDYIMSILDDYGTIGLALGPCSLPGQPPIFTLPNDEVGLGLGSSVAVMLNNLGGLSQIEQNIMHNEAVHWCESHGYGVQRTYVGPFMTSLEMHGCSISLMKVDDNKLKLLDAPTVCGGWTGARVSVGPLLPAADIYLTAYNKMTSVADQKTTAAVASESDQQLMALAVQNVVRTLIDNEDRLNQLDQAAGDGDCGTTMAQGARELEKALATEGKLNFAQPSVLMEQISQLWEESTGGTSGAIYAILLSTAGIGLAQSLAPVAWCRSFHDALQAVQNYGNAAPGNRTLVDTLDAIDRVLVRVVEMNYAVDANLISDACKNSAMATKSTASMAAGAGRAAYVNVKNLTEPDAGATAAHLIAEQILNTIKARLEKSDA